MKISVITPSIRDLDLVSHALKKQSFKGYEWLVDQSKDKKEGDYWNVYTAYNNLVRRSQGELIVSWQDYTWGKPDTLQRFWDHYQAEPKTVVSAVGNKYLNDEFLVETWHDPRIKNNGYYDCFYADIELNLASFPKEAFYAVGGFDEYFNKYSSLCGLDVLHRLHDLGGYNFKIDESIESFSTEHGRLPNWQENVPFGEPYDRRVKELKEQDKWPVLDYLQTLPV